MKTIEEIKADIRFVDWQILDIFFRMETLRHNEFLAAQKDYREEADRFDKKYPPEKTETKEPPIGVPGNMLGYHN